MKQSTHHVLDHVTDLAGIGALTYLAANGALDSGALGAITTIAIGARYAKSKWGGAYETG